MAVIIIRQDGFEEYPFGKPAEPNEEPLPQRPTIWDVPQPQIVPVTPNEPKSPPFLPFIDPNWSPPPRPRSRYNLLN